MHTGDEVGGGQHDAPAAGRLAAGPARVRVRPGVFRLPLPPRRTLVFGSTAPSSAGLVSALLDLLPSEGSVEPAPMALDTGVVASDPVASDPDVAASDSVAPAVSGPAVPLDLVVADATDPADPHLAAGDPVADDRSLGTSAAAASTAAPAPVSAAAGAVLDRSHNAALDAVAGVFRDQASCWARQQRALADLADIETQGARAGRPQFTQLELAGSCLISQLTATRLAEDAYRMVHVLTATLVQVEAGLLMRHQAEVLLTRTRLCTVLVAQQVQDQVLPVAATLTPSDLRRRVDQAILRAEATDPSSAAQRHADAVAARRVFAKPEPDGMGLAAAVLPAAQLTAWQIGLGVLEHRERLADQHAGITRTVEQRTADLFAALPAIVLAGLAQDRTSHPDPTLLAALLRTPLTQPATPTGTPCSTSTPGSGSGVSSSGGVASPAVDSAVAELLAGAGLRPWTLGPEQIAAQVLLTIHVPYATVLELSHEPGQLDRYGPLAAAHIRLLRPTLYQRVAVDARTGRPLAMHDPEAAAANTSNPASTGRADSSTSRRGHNPDNGNGNDNGNGEVRGKSGTSGSRRGDSEAAGVAERRRQQLQAMATPIVITDRDEPGHDPSARLARLIDLRDAHCCGPGCSSTRTDRDHLIAHPTGPTNARNLSRLSRRCHRAKHAGWTLTRHHDGSTTWRSPLNRTYHRPSPWTPPPATDPYDQLPTPTPPPPPSSTPDTHLTADDLVNNAGAQQKPSPAGPSTPTTLAATAQKDRRPDPRDDDHDDDPPPF